MHSRQVNIESPCHESWEAMRGAGARRFCGVCQKDVHDLSAMSRDDANALLGASERASLCVRYTAESDGTLRFRDLVPRASLTRKIVRTALAAAALAACTPHGEGPVRGLGESLIESLRADAVASEDGGCTLTTGPLTTFHLPAGHVLCADDGAEVVIVPAAPVVTRPMAMGGLGEAEPPPDEAESEPDEPPSEPAPAGRVRMGKEMAKTEPSPALEPCEPVVPAVEQAKQHDRSIRKMGVRRRRPEHDGARGNKPEE